MNVVKTKEAYAEFLASAFWVELSRRVRRRRKRCARCGSRKRLQAHHKFYRDDWYQTQEGDLEVLCRACHEAEHHIQTKVTVQPPTSTGTTTPQQPPVVIAASESPGRREKKSKRVRKVERTCAHSYRQLSNHKDALIARRNGFITREQYEELEGKFEKRRLKLQRRKGRVKSGGGWWPGMYEGKLPGQVMRERFSGNLNKVMEHPKLGGNPNRPYQAAAMMMGETWHAK